MEEKKTIAVLFDGERATPTYYSVKLQLPPSVLDDKQVFQVDIPGLFLYNGLNFVDADLWNKASKIAAYKPIIEACKVFAPTRNPDELNAILNLKIEDSFIEGLLKLYSDETMKEIVCNVTDNELLDRLISINEKSDLAKLCQTQKNKLAKKRDIPTLAIETFVS